MPAATEYAALSAEVYRDQRGGGFGSGINDLELPPGWARLERDNGFTAQARYDANFVSFTVAAYVKPATGEIVISYKGTDFLLEARARAAHTLFDLETDIGAFLGLPPAVPQFLLAANYYHEVKAWAFANNYDHAKISFTGHSLGGGLASVMAVWFDRPATTFASAPFAPSAISPLIQYEVAARLAVRGLYDSAFDSRNDSGAFRTREQRVTNYFVRGEFLQYVRSELNSIHDISNRIDAGDHPIDDALALHGMNLHAALMYDPRLADLCRTIPELMPALLSNDLFRADPNSTRIDLITSLVDHQHRVGLEATGALKRFTGEIEKLGLPSNLSVAAQTQVRTALIAVGMDYFYNTPGESALQSVFTLDTSGIHFNFEELGHNLRKSRALLTETVNQHLTAVEAKALGVSPDSRLPGHGTGRLWFQESWHLQASEGALVWSSAKHERDAAVGGTGDDILDAGASDDILIGNRGYDTLTGGTGDDELLGGDGIDTYIFEAGWGQDAITDSDGRGVIQIDGDALETATPAGDDSWFARADGQMLRLNLVSDVRSSTGLQLRVTREGRDDDVITINNFDLSAALGPSGYLGIRFDGEDRLALVGPGMTAVSGNPFQDPSFELQSLAGVVELAEGSGKAFTLYLNKPAAAGATLTLALTGMEGKHLKVALGDDTVAAHGTVIALTAGQTQVSFALVQDGDIEGGATGLMSATYSSDGHSATSNTWSISLEDAGEATGAIRGDFLVGLVPHAGPALTRQSPDGGSLEVVREGESRFATDAFGNLLAGGDVTVTDNTLFGSVFRDTILAGLGHDLVAGGSGNDSIDGGTGDDMIAGGEGGDTIFGGGGNDYISSSADIQADRQQLGPFDDWKAWGRPGNAPLHASGAMWGVYADPDDPARRVWDGMGLTRTNAQDDVIDAGAGDDHVLASWGDDRTKGGAGNDVIRGLAGNDILEGGDDDDWLDGDGRLAAGSLESVDAARHGEDFIDGGAGADEIHGGGGKDHLFGGSGHDRIFADGHGRSDSATFIPLEFQGVDYIHGEDGDDYAEGGGKDDVLYGGAGADTLWGDFIAANLLAAVADDPVASGKDYLDGQGGNDLLYGGGGDDHLVGGADHDQLVGDDGPGLPGTVHGTDQLEGGEGNDTLVGGGLGDQLFGAAGADQLHGDANDLASEHHGNDYIDGGDGNDSLVGHGGVDTLHGDAGNDLLQGDGPAVRAEHEGADLLLGGQGDDRLFGGGGDDWLEGGDGGDQLAGDAGDDFLDGAHGNDILVGGTGNDTLQDAYGDNYLQGDAGDDVLLAGIGDDELNGGDGDDALTGGLGSDRLFGGAGNDRLEAGDGADFLYGGDGDDVLDGGAGDDRFGILGTQGTKTIIDEGGVDILDLGWRLVDIELARGSLLLRHKLTGQEVHIEGFNADDPDAVSPIEQFALLHDDGGSVLVSAASLLDQSPFAAMGTGEDDLLLGTARSDQMEGRAGDDTIYGNDGHDILSGGTGSNFLAGGLGDDVYLLDPLGNDEILEHEQEGTDTVASSVSYELEDGSALENISLIGSESISATGNSGHNLLTGNGSDNELDGGFGADTLTGGLGDDVYRIDDAGDLVLEQEGGGLDGVISSIDHTLGDFVENLRLVGEAARATGNDADNRLVGTASNNILRGAAGNDWMEGGAGNDTYVVRDETGVKRILDTDGETDLVDLGWNIFAFHFVPGADGDGLGMYNLMTSQLVEIEGFDVHARDAASSVENVVLNDYIIGLGFIDVARNVAEKLEHFGISFLGTEDGDTLSGTWRRDRLFGFGGDDVLYGRLGDDALDGGDGADWMAGGEGDDVYFVDDSADIVVEHSDEGLDEVRADATDADLRGTEVEYLSMVGDGHHSGIGNALGNHISAAAGGSSLFGEGGWDRLHGGDGADQLHGGPGNDLLLGQAGDDGLHGDDGEDELFAGDGSDWLQGGAGEDLLLGEAGNDVLEGDAGHDTLQGADGDDLLSGGDGDDTLSGGLGFDELRGGAGNDSLFNGAGGDLLAGGAGDDLYIDARFGEYAIEGGGGYGLHGTQILEEEGDGTDTVLAFEDFVLGANLENLRLVQTEDDRRLRGWGNGSDNRLEAQGAGAGVDLHGFEGNDVLVGSAGLNWLDGGVGADTMVGGQGINLYRVDQAGDEVLASAEGNADTVISEIDYALGVFAENLELAESLAVTGLGNDGSNMLRGNSNDNLLDGGEGSDVLFGGAGNDILVGTQGRDVLSGEDGDDVLQGSDLGTSMAGDAGNDSLTGGAADDFLDGGADADWMSGGAGNDFYVVDHVDDVLVEAPSGGIDKVLARVDHTLAADFENLSMEGYGLTGVGNAASNLIFDTSGGNLLYGLDGDDTLVSELQWGAPSVLDGGAGDDSLLSGDAASDVMIGGAGDDMYQLGMGNHSLLEFANEGYDRVLLTAHHDHWIDLGENFEELDASESTGDLSIQARQDNNLLLGGSGSDQLFGGAGDDTLHGGQAAEVRLEEPWWRGVGSRIERLLTQGVQVPPSLEKLLADFPWHFTQESAAPDQGYYRYPAWQLSALAGEPPVQIPLFIAPWIEGEPGPGETFWIHPDGGLSWEGGGSVQDELAAWEPRGGRLPWDELVARFGLRLDLEGATAADFIAVDALFGGPGAGPELTFEDYGRLYWPRNTLPADVLVLLESEEYANLILASKAGAGADWLDGEAGDDILDGGSGNDTLLGGEGSDDLYGGDADDAKLVIVSGGEGLATRLDFGPVAPANDDLLDGGAGIDLLRGGIGDDTYFVDGEASANPLGRIASLDLCDVEHRFGMDAAATECWLADTAIEQVDEGNDKVIAQASVVLENIETVELSEAGAWLDIDARTGAGSQMLAGNSGRNTLDGGTGDDTMAGGLGDDTYRVRDAGDVVIELAEGGLDIVRTTLDRHVLGDHLEALVLEGGDDLDGSGNALDNILVGNSGGNRLEGSAGDDLLAGWSGDDLLSGGDGYDGYVFARGHGHDEVVDSEGGGWLRFSADIRQRDLRFTGSGTDLVITVGATSEAEGLQVTLRDWLTAPWRVDRIDFCEDESLALDESVFLLPPVATTDVIVVGATQVEASGNLLANDYSRTGGVVTAQASEWFGTLGRFVLAPDGSFLYAVSDLAGHAALAEGEVYADIIAEYVVSEDGPDGPRLAGDYFIVELTGANDAPVAHGDTAAVEAGSTGAWGNVLLNDADIDNGDTLSFASHGGQAGRFGAVVFDAGGSFEYTLAPDGASYLSLGAGEIGWDNFGYSVFDSYGAPSAAALSVAVTGVNDRPVIAVDAAQVVEDGQITATGNVLVNDSDPDQDDVLQVAGAGTLDGRYGTLALSLDGSYSYSLDNGHAEVQQLAAGQLLLDTFTYAVVDGAGAQASGELRVTIAGADEVSAGKVIIGTGQPDVLVGTAYADRIDGRAGADQMSGLEGDDVYLVDQGAPRGDCDDHHHHHHHHHGHGHGHGHGHHHHHPHGHGHGHRHHHDGCEDHCGPEQSQPGDRVLETADGGIDTVAASISYVLPEHLEILVLTGAGKLTGTGNGVANVLVGNAAASRLQGLHGDDVLAGRGAADTLEGGDGKDSLHGEAGADKLLGGAGHDSLWGGGGDDELADTEGNTLAAAGSGNDEIVTGWGLDVIIAGAGDDRVVAGAGNDFIDGGNGDDLIQAGSGNDFIAGGKGNDTVFAGLGRDVIAFNRGDGKDSVVALGSDARSDALSLGGGIRSADLSLRKSASDLVIGLGPQEQVTLQDWYDSSKNRTITTLQLVTRDADYDPTSPSVLQGNQVVAFDFMALVNRFDQARRGSEPWAVAASLPSVLLQASNSRALGGDLAYDYATAYSRSESLGSDMGEHAVRAEAGGLGSNVQQDFSAAPAPGTMLDPWIAMQAGTDLLTREGPVANNPITPIDSPAADVLLFAALGTSSTRPTWALQ